MSTKCEIALISTLEELFLCLCDASWQYHITDTGGSVRLLDEKCNIFLLFRNLFLLSLFLSLSGDRLVAIDASEIDLLNCFLGSLSVCQLFRLLFRLIMETYVKLFGIHHPMCFGTLRLFRVSGLSEWE